MDQIQIPDVCIQVFDHTPSSRFHYNDTYNQMQRNSTTTQITTKANGKHCQTTC